MRFRWLPSCSLLRYAPLSASYSLGAEYIVSRIIVLILEVGALVIGIVAIAVVIKILKRSMKKTTPV